MRNLTIILLLIGSVAESLKLYRVHVPHYRLEKDDALLECDYELGAASVLYSVRWYKDNEEFFRYVPRFKPPIKTHPVEGVNVDISESDSRGILLKALDLSSTGVYRCEISAEAPYFLTVHGEGRMTVVHLPKEGPQINGNLQDEYEIGDVIDLNCTSSPSFPPAKISWYINDVPVETPWVVTGGQSSSGTVIGIPLPPLPSSSSSSSQGLGNLKSHVGNSLTASTLRLRLRLSAKHFGPGGNVKVRCVASISTLFWEDGNEIAFGTRRFLTPMTTTTTTIVTGKSGGVVVVPNQHHRSDSSTRRNHSGRTNHNHYNNHNEVGGGDYFRSDSSSSTLRRNYYDSNNNLSPNPFIFNSTAFVTVRGKAPEMKYSISILIFNFTLSMLFGHQHLRSFWK